MSRRTHAELMDLVERLEAECADLRRQLDVSGYIQRTEQYMRERDDAIARAEAAEQQIAEAHTRLTAHDITDESHGSDETLTLAERIDTMADWHRQALEQEEELTEAAEQESREAYAALDDAIAWIVALSARLRAAREGQ